MALSRSTRQKALLAEIIARCNGFFTGDEVFAKASEKDRSLGLATVYRYLKEQREQGKLHVYSCGRRLLYAREERNHCHFQCEVCGTLSHFSLTKLDFLQGHVPGNVCHVQLDVHGVCENCRQRSLNSVKGTRLL